MTLSDRRKIIIAKNYIRSCNNNPWGDIKYEDPSIWTNRELLLAFDAWFNGGIAKCLT